MLSGIELVHVTDVTELVHVTDVTELVQVTEEFPGISSGYND